jgi:hypothetical protein
MATPSQFNRSYASNPWDKSQPSQFQQLQQQPFGANSLANRAATPVGRSTTDPGRLVGMISRGTARPGQVEAAKFGAAMAGQQASLANAQLSGDVYRARLEAEKKGMSQMDEIYNKFMGKDQQKEQESQNLATAPASPSAPPPTAPAPTVLSPTEQGKQAFNAMTQGVPGTVQGQSDSPKPNVLNPMGLGVPGTTPPINLAASPMNIPATFNMSQSQATGTAKKNPLNPLNVGAGPLNLGAGPLTF